MADEAQLSPFVFACQGGLVLDQSTFAMQPGMALELQNFEPDTLTQRLWRHVEQRYTRLVQPAHGQR